MPLHKKGKKSAFQGQKLVDKGCAACYNFQAIVPKAAPRAYEPRWWLILKVVIGRMYRAWPHEIIYQKEVNETMKQGIHPKYVDCKITCACGNVIETRSTRPEIRVEVCNLCLRFYTGKQKLVDTGGRVDRFNRRFGRK